MKPTTNDQNPPAGLTSKDHLWRRLGPGFLEAYIMADRPRDPIRTPKSLLALIESLEAKVADLKGAARSAVEGYGPQPDQRHLRALRTALKATEASLAAQQCATLAAFLEGLEA